jgi:hypothetical protein
MDQESLELLQLVEEGEQALQSLVQAKQELEAQVAALHSRVAQL